MGTLFLIRHADAGNRSDWEGDDSSRPLSSRGWRQAEGLRDELAETGITRLVASPSTRCVQTLEPLAAVLGLTVEADERLAEGRGCAGALDLAKELRGAPAGICSHGDVIPDVLEELLRRGMKIKDDLRWQKASTWTMSWDGDRLATARYRPPPAT